MFHHILVGLKFCRSSLEAVRKASELAVLHDARLTVFHALDYRLLGRELGGECVFARTRATERFEAEVRGNLAQGEAVRFACHPADPAMETCRLALKGNVDLIVLGCHNHPGKSLGRLDYIGMTIMEKSPCAVLLFPLIDSSDASEAE